MATFRINDELDKLTTWTRTMSRGLDREGKRDWLTGVALQFLRDVLVATPVDKGRARAGWTAFLDANGIPHHIGGSSPAAISKGRRESSFSSDFRGVTQSIEIVNGVPYIVALEFGHSRQAPAGMVRLTARRITGAVKTEGLAALQEQIIIADRAAGF